MDMLDHSVLGVFFVLLTTHVTPVAGYSSGAPPTACDLLNPGGHGPSTATGPAPYTLELSETSYQPGDVIQMTLRGVSGAQFKGYLVAGRRADGDSTDNIGEFSTDNGGNSKLICSQPLGNSLTHTEGSPKSSVFFSWTAPSTPQGDVVIHYTVVRGGAPSPDKNPADYFQDLTSVVITGPPAITVAQSGSFTKDPACGVSKGCYSNCDNNECSWETTWLEDGDVYNITLRSVFDGSDNHYVALGFSTQPAMAEASVVACVASGGNVKVAGSYNPGYSNTPLANPSEGLSHQHTSYTNGVLSCSFSREKLSSNPQIYNLTDSWYIITARGSAAPGGIIIQHDMNSRFTTKDKIDLSVKTFDETFGVHHTTSTSHTPTRTTGSSDIHFRKDQACGKSKGCYSDCDDDICSLLINWEPVNSTHFDFSIQAVYTGGGNFYIAMGFSTQDKMDKASVTACTYVDGKTDVYQSFNPGYYNEQLPDPKEGLSDIRGTFDNGIIKCTFTRIQRSAANDAKLFDLSKTWYLIVAMGEASTGGVLMAHNNKNRYLTSSRINFLDLSTDISKEELDYPLIKWHACLMIIAWMLSGSIGIAVARFFKKHWPNTTVFGLKVWFQVHRTCMALVFILGSVAIVLVFVEIEGYSDIQGESYKKAHPILGLVTTGLMVINPIMAFFRVGPDHPQRWVFNWAHWGVGASAHILAGVTISLGIYLPKAQMDKDPALFIMILYGSWHLLFGIICGVLDYLSNRAEPITKGVEVNSSASLIMDPLKKEEPPKSKALKFMLFLHVVILTAMSAFLVFLVIEGQE